MAISTHAKDGDKEIEYFNDYKLKVYLSRVFPNMVIGAIDHMFNPRDPVIAVGPVIKKAKLYCRVIIMLTKLMEKANTTLCNYLLTIKKYSVHCIILKWVSLHLI